MRKHQAEEHNEPSSTTHLQPSKTVFNFRIHFLFCENEANVQTNAKYKHEGQDVLQQQHQTEMTNGQKKFYIVFDQLLICPWQMLFTIDLAVLVLEPAAEYHSYTQAQKGRKNWTTR